MVRTTATNPSLIGIWNITKVKNIKARSWKRARSAVSAAEKPEMILNLIVTQITMRTIAIPRAIRPLVKKALPM